MRAVASPLNVPARDLAKKVQVANWRADEVGAMGPAGTHISPDFVHATPIFEKTGLAVPVAQLPGRGSNWDPTGEAGVGR